MTPKRPFAARPRARIALAGLAVSTALVGALAQPAAAYGGCESDGTVVVCVTINSAGTGAYDVHIGLDVRMSQAEAQAIIDEHGNESAVAVMFGRDYFTSENLFDVEATWVAAGPNGFSAELDRRVLQSQLNEDDDFWDRRDEVQAYVGGYATSVIRTREIHAYF
ncbi:MAG: hypothetical protein AB7W59_27290 [Acidimicrobiia bacterium]